MMPRGGDGAAALSRVIGAPNVGKSTLVNALVGSKVTIVSRKVQTTRALIRGIVIENNARSFWSTRPGFFCRNGDWIAPWCRRHGAGRTTPIWSACCSMRGAGIDVGGRRDPLQGGNRSSRKNSGAEQDRSGCARETAGG